MASFTVCRAPIVAKVAAAPKVRTSAVAAKQPISLRRTAFTRATFSRSSVVHRRQRFSFVVQATDDKLSSELEAAIQAAKDCTDDCAVEWDIVEELSGAAGDQNTTATTTEPEPLPADVLDSMKKVQSAMADAQAKVAATEDATEYLKTAQVELGKVVEKGSKEPTERVLKLQAALEAALKVAQECTENCAPDWDAVEEISAAVDKAQS